MILKSIKLENFRQFINTELFFSTDKDKNVTFVLANNSTGKTTIANAFTWCLFGKVDFPNSILLNRKVQNEMKSRESKEVSVEVQLRYGEQDYTIKRIQTYQLNQMLYGTPKLDVAGTKLIITYKNPETGTIETIDENKLSDTMNLIIPQDLVDYFFIKAEQINSMGNDVQYKRSSNDFASAVKKILGMQAIENAIKHLVGQQQNSTQAIFQKRYAGNSDQQIQKKTDAIEDFDRSIKKNTERIQNEESNITDLMERNAELTAEIRKWADGAKIQNELDQRIRKIEQMKTSIITSKNSFLKRFSSELPQLCFKKIIPEVLTFLSSTKIEDKNVPNVNNKTIEFLLKRGKCICETPLEIGSDAHSALVKLLDYVPPKYIGSSISEYVAAAKARIEDVPDLLLDYENYKKLQLQLQSNIDDEEMIVEKLNKSLKDSKDTSKYECERTENEANIRKLTSSIIRLKSEIDSAEKAKKIAENDLNKLSQANAENKHIADCIEHTKYIAAVLNKHLVTKEEDLRTKLTTLINDIFSSVFTNDYVINLDKNYRITITDNLGTPQDIDTSGAQSISVVLAFITSILNLAQQIHYDHLKQKEDAKFLIAEPYPLVLDAPFSAFDEERITTACLKLPQLTEQIIIFSKDTEGNLIKKYMKEHIGKFYTMDAATLDDNQRDVLETNVKEGDINAIIS